VAELSGLEVAALVKEIEVSLRGSYLSQIYTIGEAQIIRFRKPGEEDVWLVASPSHGMWISQKLAERAETSEFTTKLRGELERKKFVEAAQLDLDRIFVLDLNGESSRRLFLELMPPGNLTVTNDDGRITLVMREVRSPKRRLLRGEIYVAPKQMRLSPKTILPDDIKAAEAAEKTVGRVIGKHVSLPRRYVVEILGRLELAEDEPASALAGREEMVAETIKGIVKEAESEPAPCLCETETGDEIFSIRPKVFKVKEEAPSISALCDKLFLDALVNQTETRPDESKGKRKELEVTIARLKAQRQALLSDASKSRDAAMRAAGSASLDEASQYLTVMEGKAREGLSSPAAVASVLYDRAKELDKKAEEAAEAAVRLEKKLQRIEVRPGIPTKRLTRRRSEWYERFRWFYTSEGKLAVGGRDAQSNSTLIKRHMDADDTVYHADLFGSPFFILKHGAGQTEDEIKEVAQSTVAFSSAWKTGLGSADAYWVSPEQLGTAAPSGEYLARGSFVIKGKKNFVRKSIVELAVGLDMRMMVVSGPENALRKNAMGYVVIIPHREKTSDTAKRVLRDLTELARKDIGTPPTLDEVLRSLPSGGGKVVRKSGPLKLN
jgi:predicted ribosome quality control (RQC) complex YloA/Tae2 family protein